MFEEQQFRRLALPPASTPTSLDDFVTAFAMAETTAREKLRNYLTDHLPDQIDRAVTRLFDTACKEHKTGSLSVDQLPHYIESGLVVHFDAQRMMGISESDIRDVYEMAKSLPHDS